MNKDIPREDLADILRRLAPLQNKLCGKRIFLTGGTGFFGKWLLESFVLINRQYGLGATLTILSRNPEKFLSEYPKFREFREISFIQGDIRNFAFPAGHFDYVINAATEASAKLDLERPEEMYSVILEGTRRILDFTATSGARKMLFISSGAVYGTQPPELADISEDFMNTPGFEGPESAYGRGKLHAERLCLEYAAMDRFYITIARGFAFAGPYLPLDTHFAVGNFIRDCLAGRPVIIKGDGTPLRSYMYAADLAVWLWTILVKGLNDRAYNVGSEQAVSIAGLAEEVNRCFGNRSEIQILQPPVEGALPARYVPNTGRARKELNLTMDYALSQTLERTIRWHLEA
ncbi:MAG: NAD-dependent epimerase/dehydratase family protein [Victivallaceae bacterium]|jgi:dTDP-glucose 4,6-dehydratase